MRTLRLALSISASMAALLVATSARADDDAPDGPRAAEEIVVTAQKREQALLDVPQSVSVIGGETLERNQAITFQDYLKLIPGLQVSQSNPGEARVVMRGINTGGVSATVATYIDETPFGSSSGLVNSGILSGELDTFDVARLEVLRGPQGTLYGASSLGGVIKFVTNEPSTDGFEMRTRASAETAKGGKTSYMGSALVNVPLSDSLAVRASGFYRSYGGFIDSIGTGGSDVQKNINDSKSYGGRISTQFKPSDAFSIRLTAVLQNLNTDASTLVEADPQTLKPLYGTLSQSQFVPEYTNIAYRLYSGTISADLGFAQLLSSTSYSTLKQHLRDDNTILYGSLLGLYDPETGTAFGDIGMPQHTNVERVTQEVRLSSSGESMFDWMVGGYYTHEKGAILQLLEAYDAGTTTPMAGFPLLADIFLRSKYEEFAGFANGTLHFGEQFDLTFGGRYSHNAQSASQGGTGLLAPEALNAKSSEDVFTWSVAPKFKINDHTAIYARAAKGFRPGGPNLLPPGAPAGTPSTYDSDSLISYEVGLKAETADRSFSIDVAAFHIDWKDVQLYAVINDYGVNTNGGSAKSDGVEFTATMRPEAGLTVSLNGAYTDARLTDDTDPIAVGGRKGDALPFVPKWTVALNGDYEWSMGNDATAFVGGSIRLLGKQSGNYSPAYLATFDRQMTLPSYEVIDLRAGVDFGQFSVELYAKNLADVRGLTSADYSGALPNGAAGVGVIRPRTFGVTLGAGF
ncbi:TonB-dependent receptor [Novosphingobium guangzhouense]|uniref:TonB-dependent receptor n=1 Tax=Novosphingobium guangzhouense TaxID=1850347 RepID=A0A2K2G3T6_9SPHN|nr:TonB-dependent receptor [Novosphingobium guangzhouense]PNU05696.1 TonB-dependent receptor [Novosphingobium guangzhouense]